MTQLKGIVVIGVLAFSLSYLTLFIINKIYPFRADEEEEIEGLDPIECGIEAYPEFRKSF
jgi:Amt family ammonium transporter